MIYHYLLSFIEKFNKKLDKSVEGVSDKVMEIFHIYPWEGNVRELENLIEGIMSLYDVEIIEIEHLPEKFKSYKQEKSFSGFSLKEVVENTEKTLIERALRETHHNISYAAELLNIPRQTLQYKISKYNLK